MPISATGNRWGWAPASAGSFSRGCENGFTLIELLVVLAILGAMSAVVVLAIPDPHGRLVDEAERFAARTAAARDTAIISARTIRLAADADGYRFEQRQGGAWRDIVKKPLKPTGWSEGIHASKAEVAFDATGLASPEARITLQRGDERIAIAIAADGGVHVGQ